MATSISKAIKSLERKELADKRQKIVTRAEAEKLTVSGTAALGAIGAALIDERFATEQGGVGKVRGVPLNAALAGAGGLTATLWRKMPGRDIAMGISTGMGCAALYQAVREKLEWDAAEE